MTTPLFRTMRPYPNKTTTLAAPLPRARWFWQRRLQNRIVLTYGLLLMLTLVTLGVFVGREVYRVQLEQAEHDQEVSAFLIANALEDPLSGYPHALERYGVLLIEEEGGGLGTQRITNEDENEGKDENEEVEADQSNNVLGGAQRLTPEQPADEQALAVSFDDFLRHYQRSETARVTLLAINGDVIADNLFTPDQVPNQLDQIEIAAALRGAEQHDIRIDPETEVATLYAAAPVQQGRLLLGVVRVARPMHEVVRPTQLFLLNLAIGGLFALILTTVIGIGLSRFLVRPLHELEETARRIAQGELEQSAAVISADEVGTLAIAFNTMVAQLRTVIEQQRHFVANASHELRTPLTNIKLRSEAILAMDEPLPPRARQYIAEIDGEADRLRRLANMLLNLASAEQRVVAPPDAAIDIAPLLLEATRSFRLAAREVEVTLQARIPTALCLLWVWPDHLMVIVNNLLDNAIKYTPPGGEVILLVQMPANGVIIQVRDSGVGIPDEDLPHIFERFYRVDKARSRQTAGLAAGSGAGLGLAIVKTLVALNHGTITVESTVGQGTTFTVQFPCLSHKSDEIRIVA